MLRLTEREIDRVRLIHYCSVQVGSASLYTACLQQPKGQQYIELVVKSLQKVSTKKLSEREASIHLHYSHINKMDL